MNWRIPLFSIFLSHMGKGISHNLRLLNQMENLSDSDLKKEQNIRLEELLLHAYKHVPYYHDVLLKSGVITKRGEVNLKYFSNIPLLTKEIIRKEGNRIYSDDHLYRDSYFNTSGGSTGEPVKFLQDKRYWEMNGIAIKLHYNKLLGKRVGDPEINLWGSERDIYNNSLGIKANVINFIYNRTFLNAFVTSDKKLFEFVNKINIKKPVSIWAYVESIDLLARFIEKHSLSVHSPKFILTTAGVLHSGVRARIQRVFQCPVYDQYGSREVGAIGVECEQQNGFHTFPYLHFLEEINGEIVVTLLTNYSMPLIRYRIGDTGELYKSKGCKCGRPFRQIKTISGRKISHFRSKTGKIVHGQYFIHQFYFLNWVEKFKVIQESINTIQCLIVKNGSPKEEEIKKITENIKLVMGEDCDVVFTYVEDIPPSKSGKFLYTESKVR